ncbi:hypothetical protein [Flavobacterium coralii]|uniref:hypothetical protein n=1 Tax=Flavobacterium coralii TaxID=2838017 RepID=UPI000C4897AA|nr:hypothetical protein [Flavobacterium sp.]|tara:strand:- start:67 stop:555 length:489 start_codon:yes stop_codon:yes gene_type:complete
MKTNFLFPYRFKKVSGILFVISFVLLALFYIIGEFGTFEFKAKVFSVAGGSGLLGDEGDFYWLKTSITDELLMLLVIPSGIIYAFSKEKFEDELLNTIRLNSLAWATIANYTIILFGYLFIYGIVFLNVLMFAMVSQLLIFIILFRYRMFRFYKTEGNEERY